jgi:hypothetical protein
MIPQFALRLIFGLAAMWCLLPSGQITSGYFRIQMLISLGLAVLAAVTVSQFSPHDARPSERDAVQLQLFLLSLGLAGLGFFGSIAWTLERRRGGGVFAWLILLTSAAALIRITSARGEISAMLLGAVAVSFSSAAILGGVTAAMLLGHWYLTAKGMSLKPLEQYTWAFLGATTVRCAVAGIQHFGRDDFSNSQSMLLALRGGGLIGPFVMAILTLRILKYRNTQSATGVMFAATILVYMGETAAALLSAGDG